MFIDSKKLLTLVLVSIFSSLFGISLGNYLGKFLDKKYNLPEYEKQILDQDLTELENNLDQLMQNRPNNSVPVRGGDLTSSNFLINLLLEHKKNLPFVMALLFTTLGVAGVTYEDQLKNFVLLGSGKFRSSLKTIKHLKITNAFIKKLTQLATSEEVNKQREFLEQINYSPEMSVNEKLDGYRLLILDILNFDSKRKVIISIIMLVSILTYLATANIPVFAQFIGALISLIKEGKISVTVAKFIAKTISKTDVDVPKELIDAIELVDVIDLKEEKEITEALESINIYLSPPSKAPVPEQIRARLFQFWNF